jgi:redox-sensing transcriptional repressor
LREERNFSRNCNDMKIKKNIRRLLLYRLCLVKFKEMGFNKVYSYNLGHEAGVSAEQIRKDFSQFGITGNKKGGYDLEYLLERLNSIFQRNEEQKVIIVGMGNMGKALSHYECGFTEKKKYVIAGFDVDPMKIKMTYNIPVYPLADLPDFVKENGVKIAILAVPAISAQEVCSKLVAVGIKGLMNFSPVILQVPEDVIVNNVNLCDELECVMHMALPDEGSND